MPYKDKEQQKLAQQRSYERNKEIVYERSKQQRLSNRQWLNEQKNRSCDDCGGTFPPCAMDFHHRDKAAKLYSLSTAVARVGRAKVEQEISKCDLICANCHRIREYSR
jgi:hypothetical protein